MTVAAGPISLAQEHLRQTLAACAAWQTECNAGSAARAAERIYLNGLPGAEDGDQFSRAELEAYRPFALVYAAEDEPFVRNADAGGAHHSFDDGGRLILYIERTAPDARGDEPTADSNTTFLNLLGALLTEMGELAGTPGYLAILRAQITAWRVAAPDRIETDGLYQAAEIAVQW